MNPIIYQRPAPEVFERAKVMFIVDDPGVLLRNCKVRISAVMVTKITEHTFTKVTATNGRGLTHVRWKDGADWQRPPGYQNFSGEWLFADEHAAVALYRERLQLRVTHAMTLLGSYERELNNYDSLLLDNPVFELNVLERARWDHVNDRNSENTY